MTNNSQSKSLALMFLLGAFLTGGALGFVANRAMDSNKAEVRKGTANELAHELHLSEAQAAAIDSILRWRVEQDREATKPVKHLLIANRDSARVLMRQRFTPEQRTKFDSLVEANRIRAEQKKNQQDSR